MMTTHPPPISVLLERYPVLACLPPGRLEADLRGLQVIDVPERTVLFRESDPCAGFPFVLEGQIRVARGAPDGRELELYRVGGGELCVVSTGCLFGAIPMTAHGVTDRPTRLMLVDRATLLAWTEFEPIRLFVLGVMADRMAELMALVEAVAFHRLDQRLARALLGRGHQIHATHQQLADELGTAREMVSRLLKRFEDQGLLSLGREQISLRNPGTLREISDGVWVPG